MPDTEFSLARAGDVALVTIDNGEDHTKPTFFGRAALASLDRVLGELERGDFAALVLTGKPFVFATDYDNGRAVFGLPGNPVSSFVCTVRLCARYIDRLAGGSPRERWM